MSNQILILPGIGGSGSDHWQTYWEKSHPEFKRVEQKDWDHPLCEDWVNTLEAEISRNSEDTILVAHSLACLLVAHWAKQTQHKIRAALLVAIPDPQSKIFPPEANSFNPFPLQSLPFPSLVIASTNDPYGTLDYAQSCARAWGSQFENVGDLGHINSASQLKNWELGLGFLEKLKQSS